MSGLTCTPTLAAPLARRAWSPRCRRPSLRLRCRARPATRCRAAMQVRQGGCAHAQQQLKQIPCSRYKGAHRQGARQAQPREPTCPSSQGHADRPRDVALSPAPARTPRPARPPTWRCTLALALSHWPVYGTAHAACLRCPQPSAHHRPSSPPHPKPPKPPQTPPNPQTPQASWPRWRTAWTRWSASLRPAARPRPRPTPTASAARRWACCRYCPDAGACPPGGGVSGCHQACRVLGAQDVKGVQNASDGWGRGISPWSKA